MQKFVQEVWIIVYTVNIQTSISQQHILQTLFKILNKAHTFYVV